MVQVNNGQGAACDCVTGTPYWNTQGVCSCFSNNTVTNPSTPMPTHILPTGYVWRFINGRWIPTRITNTTIGTIQPSIIAPSTISNWITANKGLALAIGAGALYFLTKKK